jgi:hypothetical protein
MLLPKRAELYSGDLKIKSPNNIIRPEIAQNNSWGIRASRSQSQYQLVGSQQILDSWQSASRTAAGHRPLGQPCSAADGTTAAPQASSAPSRPLGQPRQSCPYAPSVPTMPGPGALPQPASSTTASLQPSSNKPRRGASSKPANNRVEEQASRPAASQYRTAAGTCVGLGLLGLGSRPQPGRVEGLQEIMRERETEARDLGFFRFCVQ